MIPIIKAKDPSPPTLKKGLIKLFKNFPKIRGISVLESNSVATKNGKRDGTTEFAHKLKPFFAAIRFEDENNTKQIVKSRNIKGNI